MTSLARRSILLPYLNLISGVVMVVLALVYSYALLNFNRDATGVNQLFLLMLIQLTPFIFLATRGRFNFLSFILFNHFVSYSFSKYNQLKTIRKATHFNESALVAIREMTYCTILIISSYYISRFLLSSRQDKAEKFDLLVMSRGQYLYSGLFVIAQPLLLRLVPPSLSTMYFVVSSIVLIAVLCSRTQNPMLEHWMRLGILGSTLVYFLKFGSLAIVGTMGSLLFIVSFIQWKPRNFFLVFVLLVVGSAIQSVKYAYRKMLMETPEMSITNRVEALGGLLVYEFFEGGKLEEDRLTEDAEEADEEEEVKENLLKGFARLGDDSLERVLEMTPSVVPFWNGETYTYLPYMFIPRVLWPDKPGKLAWNKFGRLYRFLSSDDEHTSVGYNFLAEGYMNFSYTGLYSVSIFFGILIMIVERFSYFLLKGNYFFSFVVFLVPLMPYGNDMVSMINSLVLTCSVVFAFRRTLLRMAVRDDYTA